jgi:hypothetical protein
MHGIGLSSLHHLLWNPLQVLPLNTCWANSSTLHSLYRTIHVVANSWSEHHESLELQYLLTSSTCKLVITLLSGNSVSVQQPFKLKMLQGNQINEARKWTPYWYPVQHQCPEVGQSTYFCHDVFLERWTITSISLFWIFWGFELERTRQSLNTIFNSCNWNWLVIYNPSLRSITPFQLYKLWNLMLSEQVKLISQQQSQYRHQNI